MKYSVVIMAAGKGTRMYSQLPKVLHKVCGKPLLFYIIQEVLKISDDIHLVLGHQANLIQENIQEKFPEKIAFHFQDLSRFPGTGGALMDGSLQKPFETKYEKILILNGDMPLILASDMQKLLQAQCDIAISVIRLANPNGYGRVLIDQDKVIAIKEDKDCTEEQKRINLVNAGVYVVDRKILEGFLPKLTNNNAQSEYYLTDIISFGINHQLKVTPIIGESNNFLGVNSKLDLSNVEEKMLDRIRRDLMLRGVILHLPHTIYIESDVEFEGECEIEQGVRITGNSKIKSSLIKSYSIIESSEIISSDVGPLAHIRPNSIISNTHIGNFVEVKASRLDGVKAGHLSYLGDCEINEGSNIGAGVITCNYDGIKKSKTFIGKNVFIGSDTQLIAPLCIPSNVLIGAGSTVTKECDEGDLVLSRTQQKNIKKGFFKFFSK